MQIILREDVPNLGKAGEVVKVRDGFARNFLIPRKKAVIADAKNVKAIEVAKKNIEKNAAKVQEQAKEIATKLNGLEITIARPAGEGERLFGSVTRMDISEALAKQGFRVDKHIIELEAPIKVIGTFEVPVKLHSEINAVLKLWVVRETK